MAIRPERTTAPRPPLSRQRVLEAAIALADEGGIGAVSMRRLGQQLGVEAMSLYRRVANKQDLLAGMVDAVAATFALPSAGTEWRTAIRHSAVSAHEVLLRHPWAAGLMLSGSGMGPARLRWLDAILVTLRDAGFSPELTHRAYHTLESHIMGFTLWVVNFPAADELAEEAAKFLRDLPVDDYPALAEHIEQHVTGSAHDGQSTFAFGLALILDGLERLRDPAGSGESGWRRPPTAG